MKIVRNGLAILTFVALIMFLFNTLNIIDISKYSDSGLLIMPLIGALLMYQNFSTHKRMLFVGSIPFLFLYFVGIFTVFVKTNAIFLNVLNIVNMVGVIIGLTLLLILTNKKQ